MPLLGKSSTGNSAVELLREDHERIKTLFREFEWAETARDKQRVLTDLLDTLTVHADMEERVFYPAVRGDSRDSAQLLDMALEEHHIAKVKIEELRSMAPDEDRFEAKAQVLSEMVKHHIKEEEAEIFSRARVGGLDLEELGARLLQHKRRSGTPSTRQGASRPRTAAVRSSREQSARPHSSLGASGKKKATPRKSVAR
jgi:hypothetical protein